MAGPSDLPVAIVGAGPFGLSVAAHLRSSGVPFRIFGTPMHRWRAHMPVGMFLKSEWDASELPDPAGRYTLQQFCILRRGRAILRKWAKSSRHVHQIRNVISARSAPK
jgi:cation diffusion facilitator CzcD-associated flavoprotein CzcO